MDDLRELTRKLWKMYVLGSGEDTFQKLGIFLNPDCVIIGTGKHEFYTNLAKFNEALEKEMMERETIQFQFRDFWCEQMDIGSDVCLVYGGLHIWWESQDKKVYINMESRFSVLYKKENDRWEIVHIHQSMPNLEQQEDEYYPKTLAEQVEESQKKLEKLKKLAEKDSLTNLINYRTFKEYYENWMFDKTWLFIFDIDKFKQINDSYGHVMGNHVLQTLAETLESAVRSSDIVCRMGGDEFIILSNGFDTEETAEEFVWRIQKKIADVMKDKVDWKGVSVGMTQVRDGETFDVAMERADADLYTKKGYD